METVVTVLMIVVCFSFVLKQTFHRVREVMAVTVVLMFFGAMTWPYAIEQSQAQIAAWLGNGQLMLDTAVLLSIDIALTFFFCVLHVDLNTSGHVSQRKRQLYRLLKYFPGLMVFPVVFSMLVTLIFALPGVSFPVISWSYGALLFLLVPSATYGLRWLLPEVEIRLEVLFLVNLLLALTGIVVTVNGRTAVAGTGEVDWRALGGIGALVVLGCLAGWGLYEIKNKKINKKRDKR